MLLGKVEEERKNAHDTNVANKIMDMLDKLRLNANTNSERRWVWELLQNAKDVRNESGKVKVEIYLNEQDKILEFRHNGKPFSIKNIVFLIEQVSTKDRDDESDTTGKFGTGFLTTHLLSEIVQVRGKLIDDDMLLKSFQVTLDRSGKHKNEIIDAIKKSYDELEKYQMDVNEQTHNIDDFNTVFSYKLDDKGMNVAKIGIEDLKNSIPYVLAFAPQIEELILVNEDIKYKIVNKTVNQLSNSYIYHVEQINNGLRDEIKILIVEDSNIAIAIPVSEYNDQVILKSYSSNVPKLFCDFPLVGTEEFPIPVIMNCVKFNPTEPRDGIWLIDNEDDKVIENKGLIQEGCTLYNKILEHFSHDWHGLYNITKVPRVISKDWFSAKWLREHVIARSKEQIVYLPLVDNANGERVALRDFNDEVLIKLPSHPKEEIRNKIWSLYSSWAPHSIPVKSDIHNWYGSLWGECRNLTLEMITKEIEDASSFIYLANDIKELSPLQWLQEYYDLIELEGELIGDITRGKYAVILNQNEELKSILDLYIDDDIQEEYKEILNILDHDCKDYLIHKSIEFKGISECRLINNEAIISKIEENLRVADDTQKSKVYDSVLMLTNTDNKSYEKQIRIIELANRVFENQYTAIKSVNTISDELLQKSINYIARCIAHEINEKENLNNFVDSLSFEDNDEALEWLDSFVDFLVTYDMENLLNKSTCPILPNQNGEFVIKDDLFLDDGDIDEALKDIAFDIGCDIRQELLEKAIRLRLPDNREKHAENLATPINSYVKNNINNKVNKDSEVKTIFKRLYKWIDENTYKAKEIFPEIYKHIHWLYDDEEISVNMKKAEAYDELMKKYSIENQDDLERILQSNQHESYHNQNKSEITDELLIQSGIYNDEDLQKAMGTSFFAENFTHSSERDPIKFEYVMSILKRSKERIFKHLVNKKGYDLKDALKIDETIYLIKKNGEETYLIIRPSDYNQVILYYGSEKDIMDYEKDWELWVEDDDNPPQKITFGKMLKLTGINRIPLRRIR